MRIADLSLRSGLSYNALSMVAQRRGWKEALTATLAPSETTEVATVSVVAVESVNRTFSALTMAAGIKAYAAVASEICQNYSRVTQKVVAIWASRIDSFINGLADSTNLSEYEANEIMRLHAQLSGFMESAARFISPTAQMQLLTAVNFSASLPPDLEGVDKNAFTIASFQKLLVEELGVKSIFDDAAAAEKAFADYRNDMPDIAGRRQP